MASPNDANVVPKEDIRQRTRSMSLAPVRERPESIPLPGLARLSPGVERLPAVGPGVDHVLNRDDNLIHKVEHMDTMINAHASVIAEGIRPPLVRQGSALEGIKSLFRATSQSALPDYDELLASSKVRPFSRADSAVVDPGRPEATRQLSDLISQAAPASGPAEEKPMAAPTPASLSPSLSTKFSGRIRKILPHNEEESERKSIGRLADEAQAALDGSMRRAAMASSRLTSRPGTPTKLSKGDGMASSNVRRGSLSGFAEGVQNLARTASRILEKMQTESLDERRQAKVAELMEKDVMVLNENQLAQMQQRSAHPLTISVNSVFRRWWDFIIAISTAYLIIATPIKVGFDVNPRGFAFAVDILIDLLFLSEIPLNMFTSFIDEATGEEVKPLKKIRQNYLYGYFLVDALSCFPSSFVNHNSALLTLSKTLKITRIYKLSRSNLFKAISSRVNRTMNPSLLRMLELTLIFCLSQHFIACTYYFICLNQHQLTSWQVPVDVREAPLFDQYVHALYFAIMVTTANDVNPMTTMEKLFTSVMLFVGIVINASIIGSAANLLSNLDKAEIARKNQMDGINDYLRFKKVPLKLQDKIRRFYEYALNSRINDPTETLFAELPDRLKLSLRLNLHDNFIRKVPLFRVCSNAGVIAIIQCLRPVVAMPQEVIIAQGELASEFYFIKNGRVSLCVRIPNQEVPLGNLGEGSFFGESSLLTGQPQQAEVKSESISELAYLTKEDFLAIVDKFPTFYLAVRRISDNRMQTANNVQRMTKMQRRQSHPHVPSMSRRVTLKKVADSVLLNHRLRASFMSAGRIFSESRRSIVGQVQHPPAEVETNDGQHPARLSQRFSSSRRNSASGLFSANYMERISLGQARHLSTLRSLNGLQIDNSADDPLWN